MDSLRVGLVGYGGAGRGIHGRLLREAGQQVTCVVTRSRALQVEEDWPGALVVPDVDALLEHADELDLVVVASPTGEHVAHVLAALDAGVHVLVDKPLATTADDAELLAARGDGRLTVFQNRRWDPEQLTLLEVLAGGELGTVHRFERRWERFRPVPQDRWKENDPDSGGLLLDLGAHLVDSAVQLFGPVAQVYAELHARSTPAVDDVFLALVHAGTGVVSHLQAGAVVGAPGPRTRVLGDGGAYLVTSFEGEPSPFSALDGTYEETRRPGEPVHEGWMVRGSDRRPVPRAAGGHVDLYRAVVRWVVDGGPPPVEPADAARTARVLDAALLSAAERRVVTLP
ncbi:Gfo/Idh/MocA family protein [Cellulomonas xylanilytica]|uniref:Oxidoreductase n=1 Tax=Cellulomonas xylanilytica TaxID=233583 RepID=A0A510UYJ4_9CELL|nr:Gfo/Idh/MocA family oxidoreductase [Cellulomonas xylanilytica]GEK19669.1 oxidoreductase [Cellulomonas xylanilytica]